jgi:hypothetical protein
LRSDNLSAATHELPLSGGRALTKRYRALLEHWSYPVSVDGIGLRYKVSCR